MNVASVVREEMAEADHVRVNEILVEHDLTLHLVFRRAPACKDFPIDDFVGVTLAGHQFSHLVHLGKASLTDKSAASVCNLNKRNEKLRLSFRFALENI